MKEKEKLEKREENYFKMKRFKKIMLGALSVLTLGLFVATGVKVNAATLSTTHSLALNDAGITKDSNDHTDTSK